MSRKFSLSTLGLPGQPLAKSIALAVEYGCDGLEVRTHPDEQVNLESTASQLASSRAQIEDAGLEASCLAGYVRICSEAPDAEVHDELQRLIATAHGMGAPSIRVFPGGDASRTPIGRERIAAALPELEAASVRLLVETHDSHPSVAAASQLTAPLGRPDLAGVLWDAVHPWMAGEDPVLSLAAAAGHLPYFQIKDLVLNPVDGSRPTPAVPGQGDLPLEQMRQLLSGWDNDGLGRDVWVSLEWELAWHPSIGPVERALPAAIDWYESLGR